MWLGGAKPSGILARQKWEGEEKSELERERDRENDEKTSDEKLLLKQESAWK